MVRFRVSHLVSIMMAFATAACTTTQGPEPSRSELTGPKQEFIAPAKGSVYNTGGDWRVSSVQRDGMRVRLDEVNGDSHVLLIGGIQIFPPLEGADYSISEARDLWPLQVGKTAYFTVDHDMGRGWSHRLEVTRREEITVPAGTFDTYVVKVRERSIANAYEAVVTYWYAPKVRAPVKRAVKQIRGNPNRAPFELQGYELASS